MGSLWNHPASQEKRQTYGGLVGAVHLRNMDEIILKQVTYLEITKELAGDSFVL